ncbi:immunity 49 family protein [Streptomyces spinoverrucosus]|nr:immunity 49 family protein [Streptomyces spinoverrucosus]
MNGHGERDMRIERHSVSAATATAAREDFTNRIGRVVHGMSKAGPITGHDWWMVGTAFLDYLGALSLEHPDLDVPEAKAVLLDAAEAAVGKVAFAAYYPVAHFEVFLHYVNFGMTYEQGESAGKAESITAGEWIDAFCLALLAGRAEWHGEAFHFARQKCQRDCAGRPAGELINGLMAYVFGDLGDDDQNFPPSRAEKLAALDAALARIHTHNSDSGDILETTALSALRAMAAGDREDFRTALAALLTYQRGAPDATPRSLLPLIPLALAALAHRREGWQPPVESGYLPRALVTGFESAGPRVKAYGRERRPDAVAELGAGPVFVGRPENPRPMNPESEAIFERGTRAVLACGDDESVSATQLLDAMRDQELLFKFRATLGAEVSDQQLENVALGSRFGAAAASSVKAPQWLTATYFALITGRREHLAPLVLIDPGVLADGSAYASYYQALHAYLRADDPEPAMDRALADLDKVARWGFQLPPAILLSQLVEGDEESFNLALIDALEAHRDHFAVADRGDDADAAIDLGILALACHARRRGWRIRISSPYLPPRLLQAAEPR